MQDVHQLIEEFAENAVEKVNSLSKLQKSEVIKLLDMKLALGRYKAALGKKATQLKIVNLLKAHEKKINSKNFLVNWRPIKSDIAQKMNIFVKDFFCKCE